MHLHQRHRRSMYAFEREPHLPRAIKPAAGIALAAFAVWWLGSSAIGMLGGSMNREPATLYTEGRGTVTVSLQGEAEQPAENGMNLFPGDSLETGPAMKAAFLFFDGTWARMDRESTVGIDESGTGKDASKLELTLEKGTLWIGAADADGSVPVARTVRAPAYTIALTRGSEVLVKPSGIAVYSSEGQGVTVSRKGEEDVIVGEGQKWALPEGDVTDPYAARAALTPADMEEAFTLESRQFAQKTSPAGSVPGTDVAAETLTLAAPPANYTLTDAMLTVSGTAGDGVAKVTVNGGEAILDAVKRTWSQQVTPPEGAAEFDIQVKALDSDGKTLATAARTVRVQAGQAAAASPDAPAITAPAAGGQTFSTDAAEVIIRGTSPATAVSIYVNEYKLQLFTPEKGTWSYLASLSLGNMKAGSNVYTITAADAAGVRSPAATLTIVQGQGNGGVAVQPSSAAGAAASSVAALNPGTLPKNAPLTPGIITVTGPTPGASHAETGTGFLLEGKTSAATATMWVNDYQLRLYQPGKTFWNYIASAAFGNLKAGDNRYHIVARDADGKILDAFDYDVRYQPAGN